jgi:hypothetical protein
MLIFNRFIGRAKQRLFSFIDLPSKKTRKHGWRLSQQDKERLRRPCGHELWLLFLKTLDSVQGLVAGQVVSNPAFRSAKSE